MSKKWGNFGIEAYWREPDGIWLGARRVSWLGVATLQLGRVSLVLTWPVRFTT